LPREPSGSAPGVARKDFETFDWRWISDRRENTYHPGDGAPRAVLLAGLGPLPAIKDWDGSSGG